MSLKFKTDKIWLGQVMWRQGESARVVDHVGNGQLIVEKENGDRYFADAGEVEVE